MSDYPDVVALARGGRRIYAITALREHTGADLDAAKKAVIAVEQAT